MKHNVIRLDDVARTVVHFFPEAVMELFVPIEDLLATTWWEWQPMSQDRSSPWQNRSQLRRLDTQLSPARWLPDASYACLARGKAQLWGVELQSRARRAPAARASTCMALLLQQAFPAMPITEIESRSIEIRTLRAPRFERVHERGLLQSRSVKALLTRPPYRTNLEQLGLVKFERTDALLRLDPNDPRFVHPLCWPLVCLSKRASADHIVLRHDRLRQLEKLCATPFTEVRLLLGLVGQARFPQDERFRTMTELSMHDNATPETLNFGHLTEQERCQILLEATARQTRIFNERLDTARQQGKLELARKVLARTLSSSALEVAMDHLSGLESAEAIDDALMAMIAGN
jgi:hypothetical protein